MTTIPTDLARTKRRQPRTPPHPQAVTVEQEGGAWAVRRFSDAELIAVFSREQDAEDFARQLPKLDSASK